jgi:hypothetical protein
MTTEDIIKNISITPSQFAKVMALSTGKKGFGQTALTYADEIICKAMGVPMPDITNTAMAWGINHEAEAIKRYEFEYLCNVTPSDRIFSDEITYVNGLPDGLLTKEQAMIEVKCPYNPTNQLDNIRDGCANVSEYPKGDYLATYWWQVQGYLWLTDSKYCDFITYDPRFPEKYQMVVQRVHPNEDDIATLKRRLQEFHEIITNRLPK